ncbi:MAG: OB-fold nucleic acid binding domain-containing protein, partial [Acidobacteriota bacterium]
LKTYFPVQYMSAVLSYEAVVTEKVVKYIDECGRVLFPDGHHGVAVRAPDINTSGKGFTPVFAEGETRDANHGHIRFGLSAIKGVGEKAVEAVIEEVAEDGPFQSLWDFCERVSQKAVNKSTLEALVKCGSFDRIHGGESRSALVAALEAAMSAGQRAAADRLSGQSNLFGLLGGGDSESSAEKPPEPMLPEVAPWELLHQLNEEKSVLGFYVSAHPLDQHEKALATYGNVNAIDLPQIADGSQVIIGGLITNVRRITIQRGRSAGKQMAVLGFEDRTGPVDAVVFSESYAKYQGRLEEDRVVFLAGKLQQREDGPSLVVDRVLPVEHVNQLARGLRIVIDASRLDSQASDGSMLSPAERALGEIRDLFRESLIGDGPEVQVRFEVHVGDQVVTIGTNGLRPKLRRGLTDRIEQTLGMPDCCHVDGPPRLRVAEQTVH